MVYEDFNDFNRRTAAGKGLHNKALKIQNMMDANVGLL